MRDSDSVVAVYSAQADAEDAVRQLRKAGYDIRNLSIVARGYHIEKRLGAHGTASEVAKARGMISAAWPDELGILSSAPGGPWQGVGAAE